MASPLPDPVPLPEIHRVLVTKLRHHGDVLLTSPVFNTLARALPGAEIDALVYQGTEPMLAGHPAIATVHTIDRNWKRQGVATQVGCEWRLLRRLRARRFDLLVHLTEHSRGLHLARLLRPRWSVTQERRSHAALWRRHFTHFYRQPEAARRHTVEANLDAQLETIGNLQPVLCTLQAHGLITVLLTSGPLEVAEAIARRFAFNHAIGSLFEVAGVAYTGRITRHLGSAGKVEELLRLSDAEGISLEECVAVGDGYSDHDLFERAGLAIGL